MPLTNYPQGVASFGIPQLGPNPLLINPSGAVLFVSSATGLNNRGRVTFPGSNASSVTGGSTQGPIGDPTKPLATLAYALTFTLAGRGDIIIVMAGHTETLAADVTCSTASTTIYGCGQIDERPLFTTAGFHLILSGVGCTIANLRFNAAAVATTTGVVRLTGAGSQAFNCKVILANLTSVGFLLGAARATLDTCEVSATTTGALTGVLFGVFDECVVTNCNIHGIFNGAPITCVANTNMVIRDSILRQLAAAVDPVITGIVTTTSGMIANNFFQSVHAATTAAFLGGANVATNIIIIYVQNFGFTGKAGPSSGVLIPDVGTVP